MLEVFQFVREHDLVNEMRPIARDSDSSGGNSSPKPHFDYSPPIAHAYMHHSQRNSNARHQHQPHGVYQPKYQR